MLRKIKCQWNVALRSFLNFNKSGGKGYKRGDRRWKAQVVVVVFKDKREKSTLLAPTQRTTFKF